MNSTRTRHIALLPTKFSASASVMFRRLYQATTGQIKRRSGEWDPRPILKNPQGRRPLLDAKILSGSYCVMSRLRGTWLSSAQEKVRNIYSLFPGLDSDDKQPFSRASICNGHAELCSRSYGSVTYLGSHDSFAFSDNPLARESDISRPD